MGSSTLEAATLFARLVVKRGLAAPEHVVECLQQLYALAAQGVAPLPKLGELLVQKGYLSREQAEETVHASSDSRPSIRPPPDEPQGERVGKYIKTEKLGEGGMGQVWKAWDTQLRRWVALKFLKHGSEEDLAYFRREAQTAGKLSHPNIAAVYEAHPSYLAMQYIEGVTLSKYSKDDVKAVVEIVRQSALAVHFAHEQGVVHRDLKPANIMIARPERRAPTTRRIPGSASKISMPIQVYVMDFGLAKPMNVDSSLSVAGKVLGTPKYMSPEQARGSVDLDYRADVYSLGATLYECLTEQPVFDDPNIYKLLRKIVEEEPKRVRKIKPAIDPDLETIVLKCLEKEPSRRYATALELAEDLKRWVEGEAILAHPPSITYRTRKWVKKNTWSWGLAAAGAIAIAGLVVLGLVVSDAAKDRRALEAIQKAERLYEAGKYVEVRAFLEDARRLRPELTEARYWSARLAVRDYQRMRGVPEARIVRGLVELAPPRPETPEEQGLRTEVEAALRDVPNVMIAQGILALWSGNLTEAFRCFLLVKADEPGAWEAEFYLGITHYLRGDFESAKKALVRHRTRDPQLTLPVWIRIHLALGQNAERTGRDFKRAYTEASAACYELGGKAGQLFEAQTLVAWGRAEESHGEGSEDKFKKALDLLKDAADPESAAVRGDAHLALAQYLRARGQLDPRDPLEYQRAIDAYAQDPSGSGMLRRAEAYWARYHYLLSAGAYSSEDLKQARIHFEKALDSNPRYADAAIGLAEVSREQKEVENPNVDPIRWYDDYFDAMKIVLEKHPAYAPAYRSRGAMFALKGTLRYARGADPNPDYQASLHDLNQALKVSPSDVESHRARGDTLRAMAVYRSSRGEDASAEFSSATESYQNALRTHPKDAPSLEKLSETCLLLASHRSKNGHDPAPEYENALQHATGAIRINAQHAEAFYARGVAYHEWANDLLTRGGDPMEKLEQAMDDFVAALKRNPRFFPAALARATALQSVAQYRAYNGGDAIAEYEEAAAEYDRCIEMNPRHSDAHRLRGECRRAIAMQRQFSGQDPSRDWENALKNFDRALELNPRNSAALCARCHARIRWGVFKNSRGEDPAPMFERAVGDADLALKINPSDAQALCARGSARQHLARFRSPSKNAIDEFDACIRDFEAATRINPKDLETLGELGQALQNRAVVRQTMTQDPMPDFEAASRAFSRALELAPNDAELLRFRGIVHYNVAVYLHRTGQDPAGRYRGAREDLTRSIELNAKSLEAYFVRANVHLGEADRVAKGGGDPQTFYRDAIDDLTRCVQLDPEDAKVLLHRAIAYYLSKRLDLSLKDLNRAAELDPSLKPTIEEWKRKFPH